MDRKLRVEGLIDRIDNLYRPDAEFGSWAKSYLNQLVGKQIPEEEFEKELAQVEKKCKGKALESTRNIFNQLDERIKKLKEGYTKIGQEAAETASLSDNIKDSAKRIKAADEKLKASLLERNAKDSEGKMEQDPATERYQKLLVVVLEQYPPLIEENYSEVQKLQQMIENIGIIKDLQNIKGHTDIIFQNLNLREEFRDEMAVYLKFVESNYSALDSLRLKVLHYMGQEIVSSSELRTTALELRQKLAEKGIINLV